MRTNTAPKTGEGRPLPGLLAFWTGIAAAASAAMIGLTSFTAFNPPNWLRIATMLPFPVLIIASMGFGLAGLKNRSSRNWAIAGLAISALSVLTFVAMIAIGS